MLESHHDELQRLAADLLPEFQAPYWIDSAEAPAALQDNTALGYTGTECDLAHMAYLVDAGRWCGRRPAIALNLTEIRNSINRETYYSDALVALAFAGSVTAVAIHELAHVADLGLSALEPTPEAALTVHQAFAYSICNDGPIRSDPEFPPWAFGHGPSWLRVLAHAAHRATAAGYKYPARELWQRPNHTCPLAHTALATCHDELTALADVPLSQINSHAPSSDYRGLWECKTTRWRETRPADDPTADNYVRFALSYFSKDFTQ